MTRTFKIGSKKILKKKTKRSRRKKRKTTRKKKLRRKRNGGSNGPVGNSEFAVGSGFVWDGLDGGMKGYITRIDKDERGNIVGVFLRVKYRNGTVGELYLDYVTFNNLSNRQIWGDNSVKQFINES